MCVLDSQKSLPVRVYRPLPPGTDGCQSEIEDLCGCRVRNAVGHAYGHYGRWPLKQQLSTARVPEGRLTTPTGDLPLYSRSGIPDIHLESPALVGRIGHPPAVGRERALEFHGFGFEERTDGFRAADVHLEDIDACDGIDVIQEKHLSVRRKRSGPLRVRTVCQAFRFPAPVCSDGENVVSAVLAGCEQHSPCIPCEETEHVVVAECQFRQRATLAAAHPDILRGAVANRRRDESGVR